MAKKDENNIILPRLKYSKENNGDFMQPRKKKRRLKKWVWQFLMIFFLIMLTISSVLIFFWLRDNDKTSKVIVDIEEITQIEEVDEDLTELVNEDANIESDYWYYIKFPLIDVNISTLKEKNADTIGWINVNNTNINYPFVQSSDNEYYLTHSFDKTYNEAGWVFLDYRNNKDLSSKNNILYAHSRLDKTMFGTLKKTLKSDWYQNKDNHIIKISTETENTLWQIFSVYDIPDETYYITTDFSSDLEFETFLNNIKGRSLYNFNASLTKDDRILTLSTCYSKSKRAVVHAKLIKRSQK